MLQSAEDLRCTAVSDRLEALVDGDLDRAAEGMVRRHLERCERCRREWQRALEVRDALRAMPTFEPPKSVCGPLLAAAESSGSRAQRFVAANVSRRRAWLAAAAAAAVLMGALLAWQTSLPARHEASGSAAQAAAEAKYAVALIAEVGRLAEQRLEQQLVDSGSLATTVRGVSLPLRWLRQGQAAGRGGRSEVRTEQSGGVKCEG